MTDAPTPPTSAPPPSDPAPPPPSPRRWDWRPKLRWFAAEYLIVVLGVLTAVGINAWWQGRQDRAHEQAYLQQLAADLHETQGVLDTGDDRAARPDRAMHQLYGAFYASQRPPQDSLLQWVYRTSWIWPVRPVVGTAEALVTTGDLALVRDDSLRSAITAYLDDARRLMVLHDGNVTRWLDHSDILFQQIDRATLLEALDSSQVASLDSVPTWTLMDRERRDPFPFSTESFLTNREAHAALLGMADMKNNLAVVRRMLRTRTDALRERVDAHIDR